jgi:hypothetical protein
MKNQHISSITARKHPEENHRDLPMSASATVKAIIDDPNTHYEVLIRQHLGGLMNSIFKSPVAKELISGQVEMGRAVVQARTTQFKIVQNAQTQALAEVANAWLESEKTVMRKNLSSDYVFALLELQEELQQFEDRFEAYVVRADAAIERTQNPGLRKMREAERDRSLQMFYETLFKLKERFKEVLDEGIDSISGDARQV